MPPPSKKRKFKESVPEEITFDPAAREEYLTGFSKRKQARIKHAQEEAAKKEKEEKLKLRRELRQTRREDRERRVGEINDLLRHNGIIDTEPTTNGDTSDNEEAFEGFEDTQPEIEPVDREDEYIDEDKYTTVTIESVGITKEGFGKPGEDDDDEAARKAAYVKKVEEKGEGEGEDKKKKKVWTKAWPKVDRPKKKKKKFRYETKAERKETRYKQGASKRKQAEARKAK